MTPVKWRPPASGNLRKVQISPKNMVKFFLWKNIFLEYCHIFFLKDGPIALSALFSFGYGVSLIKKAFYPNIYASI